MLFHQSCCSLSFLNTDRIQNLTVLCIVLVNYALTQSEISHSRPLILNSDRTDLADHPNEKTVPRRFRQKSVKGRVRFRKAHFVFDGFFHHQQKVVCILEIGGAGMENGETTHMWLKRKSCINQFQRTRAVDSRIALMAITVNDVSAGTGSDLNKLVGGTRTVPRATP